MTAAMMIASYAAMLGDIAVEARTDAAKKIDAFEGCRTAAEAALERCHCACALAERWLVFAARAQDGVADAVAVEMAAEAIAALMAEGTR